MRKLQVYPAARYSEKARVAVIADLMRGVGAEVCTDWFNGTGDGLPPPDVSRTEAQRDAKAIFDSDILVHFCWGGHRGGRHVEFGLALGMGKQVWIVGQPENIYHYLPEVRQFTHTGGMLDALRELVQSEKEKNLNVGSH